MPNISQQTNKDADRSAAALSFATMLSEGLMPKVAPEAQPEEVQEQPTESPQTPEIVPGEEIVSEIEETPLEPEPNKEIENLTKNFDEFKGEVKGIIESKFDDLTKTLKDALKDD